MMETIKAPNLKFMIKDRDLLFLSDLALWDPIRLLHPNRWIKMYMVLFKSPRPVSQSSPHKVQGAYNVNLTIQIIFPKRKLKAIRNSQRSNSNK